jgi:hypothetical protein
MDDLRKQSDTACVYESILNLHAIFEIDIFHMKNINFKNKIACKFKIDS